MNQSKDSISHDTVNCHPELKYDCLYHGSCVGDTLYTVITYDTYLIFNFMRTVVAFVHKQQRADNS